jgi:hypothetical protein
MYKNTQNLGFFKWLFLFIEGFITSYKMTIFQLHANNSLKSYVPKMIIDLIVPTK